MLEDRAGAQRLVVDRELVELAAPNSALPSRDIRYSVELANVPWPAAVAFLLEADRLSVDVGGDLFAGRRARVDHDRVVVPCARAGTRKKMLLRSELAADADAEGAAELGPRWDRPGSRPSFR